MYEAEIRAEQAKAAHLVLQNWIATQTLAQTAPYFHPSVIHPEDPEA